MPFLETLERRALFRLTRSMAFVLIFCLTAVMVIGGIFFTSDFIPNKDSQVNFETIRRELHPQDQNAASTPLDSPPSVTAVADGLNLPFLLQPYFSSKENRAVLLTKLVGLDSADRKEYIENLVEVVKIAKSSGEDVTDVINKYFELKGSQLEMAKADSLVRTQRRLYLAGASISVLILIAFASLILVLLAIERNTRRREAA